MNICYYLIFTILLFSQLKAMQQAAASSSIQTNPNTITLVSSEGNRFPVSRAIALQSETIRGEARNPITGEDVSEIPFTTISNDNLAVVARIINFINDHPNLSSRALLDALEANVTIKDPRTFIFIANFLDFKTLTQLIAKMIVSRLNLRALIPQYIKNPVFSQNLVTELERYYFLMTGNYWGNSTNKYGFSIQDYLDYQSDKLTKRFSNEMGGPSMAGLRINNLYGLVNLATAAQMTRLDLNQNQLREIPVDAFRGMNTVSHISFRNNQLATIDPHAFRGLARLRFIDLTGNNLSEEQKKQIRDHLSPKIRIEF